MEPPACSPQPIAPCLLNLVALPFAYSPATAGVLGNGAAPPFTIALAMASAQVTEEAFPLLDRLPEVRISGKWLSDIFFGGFYMAAGMGFGGAGGGATAAGTAVRVQGNLDISRVWSPQPGPQVFATICPARMILFGGARGGGKTDCALGRQVYGAMEHGYKWNGLFIRKSYKYFAELRRRIFELIRFGLPAELKGSAQSTNYLRFENGAQVMLTVIESMDKAEFFQGQQFSEISIEEACQFSFIDQLIEILKGCMRSPHGLTTRMFLTANPGGPGHNQVKARFMPYGVKPGQIMIDDFGMSSVFIPSRVEDNKILCEGDPEYVALLRSIKDPMLRRAWLEGDWDVVLGGYFSDVWNKFQHVVPFFRPPQHWPRIVGMDWGSSTPFSIGWYAVSDGETTIPECAGRTFPKGALVRFFEWYGCPKGEANVGLKMTSTLVAQRIAELEDRKRLLGVGGFDRVADPSIFAEKDGPSIAEKFSGEGVVFRRAENKRVSGWDQVRGRLRGRCIEMQKQEVVLPDGSVEEQVVFEKWEPMLYITENCTQLIRTLPIQERDETDWEDVDTDGEDHAADELRYVCMSRPHGGLTVGDITPRKAWSRTERDIAEVASRDVVGDQNLDELSRPASVGRGFLDESLNGTQAVVGRQ